MYFYVDQATEVTVNITRCPGCGIEIANCQVENLSEKGLIYADAFLNVMFSSPVYKEKTKITVISPLFCVKIEHVPFPCKQVKTI